MFKKLTAAAALAVILALTGCSEQFTFEATPVGVDDDDAEQGLTGDPYQFECFTIEADSSGGDDNDQQLGEFCRVDNPSNDARDRADDERDDDE